MLRRGTEIILIHALHGTSGAYFKPRMNENGPMPGFSVTQSDSLKRKLRSLRWRPEAVMRETVLIQQLREIALIANGEG